ncbi:DUF930 domain-containing protein [Bradyrhizobium sp. 14AA]
MMAVKTSTTWLASIAAVGLTLLWPPQIALSAKSHDEQMQTLSSETRIEQRCNARAMGVIGREHQGFRPDEFVAYAFADPVIRGHLITAEGAALRSRGTWYHVAYRCETNDDGLRIQSFSYTLGTSVPRQEWNSHYLVP